MLAVLLNLSERAWTALGIGLLLPVMGIWAWLGGEDVTTAMVGAFFYGLIGSRWWRERLEERHLATRPVDIHSVPEPVPQAVAVRYAMHAPLPNTAEYRRDALVLLVGLAQMRRIRRFVQLPAAGLTILVVVPAMDWTSAWAVPVALIVAMIAYPLSDSAVPMRRRIAALQQAEAEAGPPGSV